VIGLLTLAETITTRSNLVETPQEIVHVIYITNSLLQT